MFTACKPSSSIITSKEVAVKKGVYSEPILAKISTVKKKNNKRDFVAKQVAPSIKHKQALKIDDQNESDIVINNEDSNYFIEQLINSASDNLGVNYRAGGTSPDGFDCSGLMFSTFKKFDITLPRSSNEMAEIGTQIDPEKAKKGDLIFFINRGQRRINHVGMIVDINGEEIKFIHSSTQSGVIISSLKESYYERTFKQINRIIE
jgi:cell wall-associated NlpC family hydrolase